MGKSQFFHRFLAGFNPTCVGVYLLRNSCLSKFIRLVYVAKSTRYCFCLTANYMQSFAHSSNLDQSRLVYYAEFDRQGTYTYGNAPLREVSATNDPFQLLLKDLDYIYLQNQLKSSSPAIHEFRAQNAHHSLRLEIMPRLDDQGIKRGSSVLALAEAWPSEQITGQQQFEAILRYAPIGMALLELNGKWIRVNQALCQFIGYTEAELLEMDFQSITHPEDLAEDLALANQVIRGEIASYALEKRYLHKNGSVVWGLLTVTLARQGNMSCFISQIQDITATKQSYQALKKSEEKFRLMSENSRDTMALLDQQGRWLYGNPYVSRLTGYTLDTLLGKPYAELVHPDDLPALTEMYRELMAHPDQTFKSRHRIVNAQGQTRWLEGYIVNKLDLEGLNAIIGNFQDITSLVYSSQKIEDSEKLFRTALEYSASGVALTSKEGVCLTVNRAFCQMLGYTEQEMLGKTFDSLTYGENPQTFERLGQQQTYQTEERYVHKTGKIVWVLLSIARLDLEPHHFIVQAADITDRKQAEEEISQKKAQLALLSNHLYGLMIFQAVQEPGKPLRFTYVSDTVREATGQPAQEVIHNADLLFKRIHPDDYQQLREKLRTSLKSRQPLKIELRVINAHQEARWVRVRATPRLLDDGTVVWEGYQVDVTQRKEALEELKRSEANLRVVLDHTEIGYVLLDTQGRIRLYNQRFTELCRPETKPHVAHTERFIDLVSPERRLVVEAMLQQVLTTGEGIGYELYDEQRELYFYVTIHLVREEQVLGLCLSMQDISRRKQVELEQQRMTQEVLLKNHNLEQFASIVSHNLRAPVANVLGLTEILQQPDLPESERQQLLEDVVLCTQRLDQVIKDLNQIVSLRHEVPTEKEWVHLPQLVAHIQAQLQPSLTAKRAQLVTDFSQVDEWYTVRSYFYSIVSQLISNALKFSQPDHEPLIYISGAMQEDIFQLVVEDNGLGIDLHRKSEQVFGLYQRFHRPIEGKGMGLYLMKTQVELLGGQVFVESELGRGSRFTLKFPVLSAVSI